MEDVENLEPVTEDMLACCLCKQLLQQAVQLMCLHNSCRKCFSEAAANSNCEEVACRACGTVSRAGMEQPNNFIDYQVQCHTSAADGSELCDVCKENSKPDEEAVEWCAVCQHSLCEDCLFKHRQYKTQHATQSLVGLRSIEKRSQQLSASTCAIHNAPVKLACRDCEQAKCVDCCADCLEKKHEVCVINTESFDSYVGSVIGSLHSMVTALLRKSEALADSRDTLRCLEAARDAHLKEIEQRKRRIMDAVESAFEEIESSIKDTYDEVQGQCLEAAAAAARITLNVSDVRTYALLLLESNEKCAIINQQKIVRERLQVLSAKVDALTEELSRAVNICATLPDDLENIIREWIGKPVLSSGSQSHCLYSLEQQRQQSVLFGAASVRLQLPVHCCDVALTKDGRRLLAAAGQEGLIELSCSSGRELSRWRPPMRRSSSSQADSWDWVQAVVALSDGRAALSVHYAQHVVLLKRSDNAGTDRAPAAAVGVAWTEDCRFDQLPWRPGSLSAHGDLLAAAQYFGTGLQLLSPSSGQLLSIERQREYRISSLAVCASVIITLSEDKTELGGGRRAAQVLDAHSLTDGDERLWRLEVEQEEELLQGVCADSTGGCLYAAVQRIDRSSGRVCALSLVDGSELQHVSLSFCSVAAANLQLLLPVQLSLSDEGAAAEQQEWNKESSGTSGRSLLLAALCWNSMSGQQKTVTVYRSS